MNLFCTGILNPFLFQDCCYQCCFDHYYLDFQNIRFIPELLTCYNISIGRIVNMTIYYCNMIIRSIVIFFVIWRVSCIFAVLGNFIGQLHVCDKIQKNLYFREILCLIRLVSLAVSSCPEFKIITSPGSYSPFSSLF